MQPLFAEALKYLYLAYHECRMPHSLEERQAQIQDDLERMGSYWQTTEELNYGARVAWRNSSRCIGRLHWQSLCVRDLRHISTAEELFAALVEHLHLATNGGKIRPMISIFAPQLPGKPGIRIWNSQLIRYAGYRQPDGSVIGDPMQVKMTSVLQDMGWKRDKETHFDVLPLIIQMPHQSPQIFDLPADAVLEVPLSHPDYPWFEHLGLKWHALPVISNMRLEIGGIAYTAAPFN
ncbi:MAG TPA: nitric oxide synthase oxygenase, partial [Ktedonobacteraceae bacterium]